MACVVVCVLVILPTQALGQDATSIAGGTDIPIGAVISVPAGGEIPRVHYIYVHNTTDQSVKVQFEYDAPPGVELTPDMPGAEVPAGGTQYIYFGIRVRKSVPKGQYSVKMRLKRADITVSKGEVPIVPAIGGDFLLDVPGEAGTLIVNAVRSEDKKPVEGTIEVYYINPDGSPAQVNTGFGSSLTSLVAPGPYEARFVQGKVTAARVKGVVKRNDTTTLTMSVDVLSFKWVSLKQRKQGRRLLAVDLAAQVSNQYQPISGEVKLQVDVSRDKRHVDTADLKEWPELPKGDSDAKLTYLPPDGWHEGTYRFKFKLVTPQFTVVAPDVPRLTIMDVIFGVLLFAVLLLVIAIILFLVWRRHKRKKEQLRYHPFVPAAAVAPGSRPGRKQRGK